MYITWYCIICLSLRSCNDHSNNFLVATAFDMDQASQTQPPFRGEIGHIPHSSKPPRGTSDDGSKPPKSNASDPGLSSRSITSSRSSSMRARSRHQLQTPLGILTNPTGVSQNRSASTKSTSTKSAPLTRNPSKGSNLDEDKNDPVISVLETTPPGREAYDLTSHDPGLDENRVLNDDQYGQPQEVPNRRKPRPSLSDRTIETLSQLPPSPSPGKRLSTVANSTKSMGPPSYPASTIRRSKTRNAVGTGMTNSSSKQETPTKNSLKAPVPSLPVKTPPTAHLSRLPVPSPMTSPSKVTNKTPVGGLTKPTATIRRASSRNTMAIRPTRDRRSLSTIFKDVPKARSVSSSVDRSRQIDRTAVVLRTPSQESLALTMSESASVSMSRSSSSSSTPSLHAADVKTHTSIVTSGTFDRISSIGSWSSQVVADSQRLEQSPERLSLYDTTADEGVPETASSVLNLAGNDLSEFPMSILTDPIIFTNVAILDLSHNTLDSATCLTTTLFLPHLRKLSLVSTGLTNIMALATHLSAPQLTHLNISSHRLSGPVPKFRYYFPKLEEVIAKDGWFDVVETKTVVGLKRLDLQNNLIGESDVEDRRQDWKVLGCEVLL